MKYFQHLLFSVAATLALPVLAQEAQGRAAQMDVTLSALERRQIVDDLIREINTSYVFPDLAVKVEAALRSHQGSGSYDKISSGRALSAAVTRDLLAVTNDKHLKLRYSESAIPLPGPTRAPSADELARQLAYSRAENFGVERVERLPGNIGYLALNQFANLKQAADTLAAAMTLVAHTSALIIDLRNNGGGDPASMTFLTSYLLDRRTHISDLQPRQRDLTEQFWSLDTVPGLRYGEKKPVYVLTSSDTFSAAEGFTYALQSLKRVTVVGETTRGGAHPGRFIRLAAHFSVFVPRSRAVDPRTKGNWEGVGVKPDVNVPAAGALETAQLDILNTFADSEPDSVRKAAIQSRIASIAKLAGQAASAAHPQEVR